jgi:hypothetical protein
LNWFDWFNWLNWFNWFDWFDSVVAAATPSNSTSCGSGLQPRKGLKNQESYAHHRPTFEPIKRIKQIKPIKLFFTP